MTFINAVRMMRKPAADNKSDFQIEAETHTLLALLIGDTEVVSGNSLTNANITSETGIDGLPAIGTTAEFVEKVSLDGGATTGNVSLAMVWSMTVLSGSLSRFGVDSDSIATADAVIQVNDYYKATSRTDGRDSTGTYPTNNTTTPGLWGFSYMESEPGVGGRIWTYNQDTDAWEYGERGRADHTSGADLLFVNPEVGFQVAALAVFDGYLSTTDRDALLDTVPTCK